LELICTVGTSEVGLNGSNRWNRWNVFDLIISEVDVAHKTEIR
jgi:hypothetical protein